ncbi:MAG: MFS transporter [Christensenellales bacterium]
MPLKIQRQTGRIRKWSLLGNILVLGIVSFFIDLSTEMVYPIVPLYLTSVLGATPAIVGLIEGIAESLASFLKIGSGYITDKNNNRKKFTFFGYCGSIVYKGALLLASTWPGILAARVIDRIGKGLRTAPRDALIAQSAGENKLGGSFGFHKMLDMLGSACGIMIAYLLISGSAVNYKQIFWLSLIPAVLGVCAIYFVKERKTGKPAAQKFSFRFSALDNRLKGFLLIIFVFSLGNSSNAFLLLRAKNAGFDDKSVILLYFLFNIAASLFSYPLGRLSDKIGRRWILVAGYAIYGAVYVGFAVLSSQTGMIALFAAYGVYTALTSGAERALISEISPSHLRGTMLGLHAALVGIALLPASIIAGLLWDVIGASAPFWFGGGLALIASIAVSIILRKKPAAACS